MIKTKEELNDLTNKLHELSEDDLAKVTGGTGDKQEMIDLLIMAMEGVVIVDQSTMNQIKNLSVNQIGDLFFSLVANFLGAEISKEHRYQTFTRRLTEFGISTSGCQKAF